MNHYKKILLLTFSLIINSIHSTETSAPHKDIQSKILSEQLYLAQLPQETLNKVNINSEELSCDMNNIITEISSSNISNKEKQSLLNLLLLKYLSIAYFKYTQDNKSLTLSRIAEIKDSLDEYSFYKDKSIHIFEYLAEGTFAVWLMASFVLAFTQPSKTLLIGESIVLLGLVAYLWHKEYTSPITRPKKYWDEKLLLELAEITDHYFLGIINNLKAYPSETIKNLCSEAESTYKELMNHGFMTQPDFITGKREILQNDLKTFHQILVEYKKKLQNRIIS
ncbi:hypothetical protein FJ366_01130 [Candidatus Dependentiae bacterium]|nr:hypothetical protein [Candidatus Dependentiae bacterium]